jgi:hypothetical protein
MMVMQIRTGVMRICMGVMQIRMWGLRIFISGAQVPSPQGLRRVHLV